MLRMVIRMTGKVKVKVKLGYSKDERYIGPSGTRDDGYPFWYLEITGGEDVDKQGNCIGKISTVSLTPSWTQLKTLIKDIKVHEIRVDLNRERKNDADRWQEIMKQAIEEAQTKIKDFDLPGIYNKPEFRECPNKNNN